jgi:YbbR domain-containing protein
MAWHPFRHVGLKIAALILGTFLWFTVSGNQIERRVAVPVSYSNVPAALEMTGDQVDGATVHVRGEDNLVAGLAPGDLRVIVDLKDAHAGNNLVALQTGQVIVPLGVEVLQVDPGAVSVTLEPTGRIEALVAPTVEGQPAPGYEAKQVTVEPATVVVFGPESRLRYPVSVVTERVSIEGRRTTMVQEVSVFVLDAQLRLRNPGTVRVTVRIEP